MAMLGNQLYAFGKGHLLSGSIDTETVTGDGRLKAALVNSSYNAAYTDLSYYTSISNAGYTIGDSITLTGSVIAVDHSGGTVTFDANDTVFPTVAAGSTVDKIVIYVAGSTPGTNDYLLVYFDVDADGGIDTITNGGNITVSWNGSGIFAL